MASASQKTASPLTVRKLWRLPFKALKHSVIRAASATGFAVPIQGTEIADGLWNPQTRRHQELVEFIQASKIAPDAKFLDVGCGPGWLVSRLQKAGYLNIEGCDWNDIEIKHFPYRRVDLNRERLSAYADHSFDVVVSSDVLEHLENPAEILREMKRVLKPNGHLFITIPNCWNVFERLVFLFTGNSTRYRSERQSGAWGHISMLPSAVLESLTDRAGLQLVELRGGYALYYGYFWGSNRRPLFSYNLLYHYRSS